MRSIWQHRPGLVVGLAACAALLTAGAAHASPAAPATSAGIGCWVSWHDGFGGRYEHRTYLNDGEWGRNGNATVQCRDGHYVNVTPNVFN
ncbi:hypothetical protein ACWCQK_32780 [Streptomyces sp. NPDC002306]